MQTPFMQIAGQIPPRTPVRKTLVQSDPDRNYAPPCRRLRLTPAERAARRHERIERPLAA